VLSTLAAVGSCINKLPSNGGIAKTKGGRKNGGTRDVLVAVVLRFWCGDIQSDTARVVCNLGGDWLDCVAVNYWHRFILNLDALGASRCVASTIGKIPCNSGIAKTKGGRQNRQYLHVLVAVVLRFWCGNSQSDAASIVGNFGSNWLNCEQSITGTDLSDTVIC
jgi:hypothetical protein